jgi:hypothetical protein
MSTVGYTREHRPAVVRAVCVALIVIGLAGALIDVGLLTLFRSTLGADPAPFTVGAVAVALVLAVAEAVSGAVLLTGREAARRAAIVVCGLNIASAVTTIIAGAGAAASVGIAANVGIIALLARYAQAWRRDS